MHPLHSLQLGAGCILGSNVSRVRAESCGTRSYFFQSDSHAIPGALFPRLELSPLFGFTIPRKNPHSTGGKETLSTEENEKLRKDENELFGKNEK